MATAKLFKNGQSQAVRLPREFALPGKEVFIRRIGRNVLLVPKDDPWDSLIKSLDQFSDDFMGQRDQPGADVRESF
jgi:antitoxin VapB